MHLINNAIQTAHYYLLGHTNLIFRFSDPPPNNLINFSQKRDKCILLKKFGGRPKNVIIAENCCYTLPCNPLLNSELLHCFLTFRMYLFCEFDVTILLLITGVRII